MEYKIERKGNHGYITPIPQSVLAEALNRYMSYEKQGREFMPNPAWGIVKLYSVKQGKFPWGLRNIVFKIMRKWCEDGANDSYIFDAPFIEYPDFVFSDNLRYYQREAIEMLLINAGGVLCMPTGSGKTKTIIEYLRIMNKKTCVIVPTLDIKKQWERQVGHLSFVRVINHQSPLALEIAKISNIVVFDECHHVSAKTIYDIAMKTISNTILIGCSATPKREDGEDLKINAALGEIVYSIDRKKLIQEKFLSDAEVFIYTPAFDTKEDKFLNYSEIYKKHIVENVDRNKYIIENVKMYNAMGKKILVLVSQIEHGQYLFDHFEVENKIYCHGSSNNREQDLSKFDVIVASNIFNEGVDLPSLDVLILASGGKSSIQMTQKIGRVLRPQLGKKAIIVDFNDLPKHLILHSKRRRAILEEDFEVTSI
jgi:superfamily II DNA or RNA helicase